MIIDKTELYLAQIKPWAQHKIIADKLSGSGWISQVKLKDNQVWSDTSNFVLRSWLTLFTDWAMSNIHFFTPLFLVGFVPSPNHGENSGRLCIKLSNLQFVNFQEI